MSHENVEIKEKVIDLQGTTLSIWKVHPDALREQDKNARYMDSPVFTRLTENIKNAKQLESLPYCHKTTSPGGAVEFSIISGHHRVRAARKAGLTSLFVLVEERDLTRAQVTAKQLAHNALAGADDEQMLAELYASIDEVNAKLEAGIFTLEQKIEVNAGRLEDVKFDFEYEQVALLFLKHEYANFMEVVKELEDDLAQASQICLCGHEQFEAYKQMIKEVSKRENIRNTTAVMARIMEIVAAYLRSTAPEKNMEKRGTLL